MPKSKNTDKNIKLDENLVDLSSLSHSRRIVSVNGETLPLAIGDKILINDQDHLVKMITSIQIYEDGRIGYMLEWFDFSDSSFKTEWVTSTELAFLSKARKEKNTIKMPGQV